MLSAMDTHGKFSVIFTKHFTLVTSSGFLYTKPLLKPNLLFNYKICSSGANSLLLEKTPTDMGGKNIFDIIPSHQSISIPHNQPKQYYPSTCAGAKLSPLAIALCFACLLAPLPA